MEKIGIVICNYNKENDVVLCIQAVLENKFEDYHIYVVDNASTDASVEKIRENYGQNPKLTLLINGENLGGSGGFNTGLRAALVAGHPYLMCVDNDAFLDENCIGYLLEFLESHEDVGIAAAKIYHRGMEDYVQQYGSFIDFKNYEVNSIYLNHFEDGTMPPVVYSDAVPACALMIKKTVVDIIGILPEENFLYWDDTEWCFRCSDAGYKVASVGPAMAVHAMGAKKEDVNTFPTYYAWRNWLVFFLQHLPKSQLEDFAKVVLGSVFETAYVGLFRGEKNKTSTIMAAMDDALHGVTGKAGKDRIFDIEGTYDGIERMIQGKKNILIETNGYPLYGDYLKNYIGDRAQVTLTSKEDPIKTAENFDCVVSLCESIFRQDDISLKRYVVDLDGNVLSNEDEVLMVINYNYSKQSFIFAEKPLFLRLAYELRKPKREV